MPDDSVKQQQSEREGLVEATLAALDALFRGLSGVHAPEFLEIPITMPQAKVLLLATAGRSLHMSDLSARLGVTLSTISGLVDKLVEAGLLDRREDPADRRQTIVRATPAGADLVERFQELNAEHLLALLEHVSTPDLVVVQRAFTILADAATTEPPRAATSVRRDTQQQEHVAP